MLMVSLAVGACADAGISSNKADVGNGRDTGVPTGGSGGMITGGDPTGGVGGTGGLGGTPVGGSDGGTGGTPTGGTGGTGGTPAECADGTSRGCSLEGCPDDPARKGTQLCEAGAWGPCVSADGCNDRDDDCDGETDEDVEGKGDACAAGEGACRRDGVQVCGDANDVVCDAVPGAPEAEICDNGTDEDCDGVADNGCPAGCEVDADCPAGDVCTAGVCEPGPVGCQNDGDCAAGEICVDGVCELEPVGCLADEDCAAGEICVNNLCEPEPVDCRDDADCAAGEICLNNTCEPAPPECNDDFDCAAGEVCVNETCEPAPPECVVDADCRVGEVCVNQSCEPAPAECMVDLDCDVGERCENGDCVLASGGCRNDADCGVDEFCDAGFCAPVPQPCVPDAHEEDDDSAAAVAAGVPSAVDLNHCDDGADWHTFVANVGSAYDLRTSNLGAQSDTVIELYDTDGVTLITGNDDVANGDLSSAILGWEPPAAGTYYVAVLSFGGEQGADREYTFSLDEACLDDVFEEDDAQDQSTLFAVGAGAELHRHCDPDWTSFAATAGSSYVIETANLVGQTDTVLELYDVDGQTVLTTNDDFGGTLASHIDFVAPANGTYFVRVGALNEVYGGERGYTLDIRAAAEPQCRADADCGPGDICDQGVCVPNPVRCEPDTNEEDDDLASARPLAVGRQFADLSFCDDAMDWTSFAAVAGATYDVQTFNLAAGTDTVVDLYDADGVTLLASNDDGAGDGVASLIAGFTAPADATYYVMTRSYGDEFGPDRTYSLGIRETCTDDAFEHDDDPARARAVDVGLTDEAHSHCEDADWLRFDAVAGTTYVLQTGNLAGGDDTLIALFDAAGALLAQDDDAGGNLASRLQWQAPADGTYWLRIGTFGETYGAARTYTVSLSTAARCDGVVGCPAGQICNAGVCEPAPVQCVVDADCEPGFGCQAGVCVEVPRCAPDANEEDDEVAQAHVLPIGTPVQALNHCDDAIDVFQFEAAAGQALDFATSGLGAQADTLLVLLDVDGVTELERNDDRGNGDVSSLIVGWVAPAAGTYTLVVASFGGNQGADREYTVIAYETCVDDAFEEDDTVGQRRAIGIGELQHHAHCADEDWVSFTAEAGREYRIETSNLVGGDDSLIDLVDLDGATVLATDDDGAGYPASRIVFTPAAGGDYSVRVRTYGNRYGGARAYDLTVGLNVGGCTVDADCPPEQICQAGVCVAAPPRCAPDAQEEDDTVADARLATVGRNASLNFCDDGSDWLAFDAEAGVTYDFQTFNLEAAGQTDTLLELIGPDGTTVLRRDDDGAGDGLASLIGGWAAPEAGRYFLHVLSFRNRIGNDMGYSVGIRVSCGDDAFEHDDGPATARAFVPGEPAQARSLCQDADWVRFAAVAGRGYRIETRNLVAPTDTVVTVFGPDGAALGTDDDSNGNRASRLDWVAPADGEYRVAVSAFGEIYGGVTGYELSITEIDAAGVCAADADCNVGEVCVAGQCLLAPGACRVDADCPAGLACVAATCQAVVRCSPDANEEDDVVADAKALAIGHSVTLNFCDDATDWLALDLVGGVSYDLYTEALEGATDTVLVLFDAAGAEVARDDDAGGGRRSLIDGFVPGADGRFLLAVQSFGSATGDALSYRIGVVEHCAEDVYEDDDAPEANHPFAVNGGAERHAHCRDADWVTLDVVVGQAYTITTSVEGGADTLLDVYGVDGARLATDDDSGPGLGSQVTFTALDPGQVFVRIIEYGDVYGGARAYTLDVLGGCRADADCPAGEACVAGTCQAIAACEVDRFEQDDSRETAFVEGRLDTTSDRNFCDDAADWVAFDLVAGTAYDFETMGLTPGTDTVLDLYTADGVDPVASDDDGGRVGTASLIDAFTPLADGRYLLLARSFNGQAGNAAAYRLSVREHCVEDAFEDDDSAETASAVALGAPAVAHAHCADEDWISFDALAGRAYRIETSALVGGADTIITLFDTDGVTSLLSNDDGPNGLASRIDWTAPADGTYTVRIASYQDRYGAGRAYSVGVTGL